jgi:magnesium transporter
MPIENNKQLDKTPLKVGSLLESKTSHLDDILKEKLENAYHKETSNVSVQQIAKIASEHSPIDLAYAVSNLPPHVRPVLYDNLPHVDAKVEFVINTDSDTRVKIFRYMKDNEMKKLFEKMSTDEAVSISEEISERRFRRMMELIDLKKAAKIREQRKHPRNSAGRLMSNEFFAFTMDATIEEAISEIRDNPRIDSTKGIFIINNEGELQGYVPSRNLLINNADLTLKQIMRPILYKVTPEATREEVVDIVERYKVSSLPVVDNSDCLVGIIPYEDVIEVMEDLADETIAKITGTAEKVSVTDTLVKRFLARSPWLIVTLFSGLINVCVMSSFQTFKGKFLTFALFFVPLITGLSGTVGIQCSTVLVRSMAMGKISHRTKGDAMVKELIIGLFTGIIFGISCGILVYCIDLFIGTSPHTALAIGVIIGTGLVGACFAATVLGVVSPIFFAGRGVDPAISSGPIVTAFNDFFSLTIYFLIAWGLGSLFF